MGAFGFPRTRFCRLAFGALYLLLYIQILIIGLLGILVLIEKAITGKNILISWPPRFARGRTTTRTVPFSVGLISFFDFLVHQLLKFKPLALLRVSSFRFFIFSCFLHIFSIFLIESLHFSITKFLKLGRQIKNGPFSNDGNTRMIDHSFVLSAK